MSKLINCSAVDYKVVIDFKQQKIQVIIIDNDTINLYGLSNIRSNNSKSINYDQFHWGYEITYTTQQNLNEILKLLKINGAGKKYINALKSNDEVTIYVSNRGL